MVMKKTLLILVFLICGLIMSEEVKKEQGEKKIFKKFKVSADVEEKKVVSKEVVEIITEDEWILKGDFYKVDYDKEGKLQGKTILLLHMLPADRSSFNQIIGDLTELGFNILNLDWRGHGESIYKVEKCLKGGHPTTAACPPPRPYSYKEFTKEDYRNAITDVEAAIKFLEEKGAKK